MKGVAVLTVGTIYRMPKPIQEKCRFVDGLPNFYYEAQTPGFGFAFQRGIHKVKEVVDPNGKTRCPLIIISSTPRKAGSEDTPWRDRYDPDHGYVNYYGDNKSIEIKPEEAIGNRLLLKSLKYYKCDSKEDRMNYCIPIIFFEKVAVDGRPKGNALFHGFGILESAELVTQYDKNHCYFANYRFTFCVLSLAKENEQFNWQWISDRCDSTKTASETLKYAPYSWKRLINNGIDCLHLIRRNVSGKNLVKKKDQLPGNQALLQQIYNYYSFVAHKHDFEFLAMEVTVKTIEESGAKCVPGWVTKMSSDGGVDFVLRVDIGQDQLASVEIIVLGQAKCEAYNVPTNGVHIARTVARLKRGWIGVYVTTSFFSEAVQKEVREDAYPILLINGAKISMIVERELFVSKQTLEEYLDSLSLKYKRDMKIPEAILEE